MGIASLVIGILTVGGVCLSLVPLLNLANCLVLPLALLGAILGLAGLFRQKGRGAAIAGLCLNSLALMVGVVRVVLSCLAGACIL